MTYPDPPLFPADTESKAIVLQRYFEVIAMNDTIRDYVRPKMMNQPDPEEAQNQEKIVKEFELWDSYLAKTKYIATNEFSIADIMLIPSVMFLTRFGMTFKDYPNLKRYHDTMKNRPSVVKTMPPHWKESQGPNLLSIF